MVFIYLEFRLNNRYFLAVKCKRNYYLLQPSAPFLQLHQGRVSAARPRREPPPPASRRGTSHRRGRCSLPAHTQSSLCPPRLQLRGCVRLTLSRGCSPPVKRMNRSIVQKPLLQLAGWSNKGDAQRTLGWGCPLLYPILTSACDQII